MKPKPNIIINILTIIQYSASVLVITFGFEACLLLGYDMITLNPQTETGEIILARFFGLLIMGAALVLVSGFAESARHSFESKRRCWK